MAGSTEVYVVQIKLARVQRLGTNAAPMGETLAFKTIYFDCPLT